MIPKIIHYCWLSNDPIPDDLKRYMDTWKKFLPDYKLMLWNFDRFPKTQSAWVKDAFNNKKYAFAADYIRLYSVYHYGGIYLDMDVEVVKSFDPLLKNDLMLGWQYDKDGVEIAAFGAEKHSIWIKECLDYYDRRRFVRDDGTLNTMVMPVIISMLSKESGYTFVDVKNVDEYMNMRADHIIPLYPATYFSPKSFLTGQVYATSDTFSIHHFAGSWTRPHGIGIFIYELKIWYKDHIIPTLKAMNLYKIIWHCMHPFSRRRFPDEEDKIIKDSNYYLH